MLVVEVQLDEKMKAKQLRGLIERLKETPGVKNVKTKYKPETGGNGQ